MRATDLTSTTISRKVERNFDASNTAGMTEIGRDIAEKRRDCKDTHFVLAGYSQGAWVIDRYLRSAKTDVISKIDAVALYGDPQWDRGSQGQGLARILSNKFKTWSIPGPYPGLKDRTQSICSSKDPICGGGYKKSKPGLLPVTQAIDAWKCSGSKQCPHYLYKPAATRQGGEFLGMKAYPKSSAPKAVDWKNRTYGLTCDNIVDKPVKVAVHHGVGIARGSGIGAGYDRWDVKVQGIAQGRLPGLGNVTSVLFYCSPQASNFFVQELRVYRTRDGSEVGRTPTFNVSGLPPQYQPKSLAIRNGRLTADVKFYGPKDSHATGPSILRHVTWTWNGQRFVAHGASARSKRNPARVDLRHQPITVNGIGPVKLGMSRTQSEKAVGGSIPNGPGGPGCTDLSVKGGPEGLLLRFARGKLVAIYVLPSASPSISTASGIHRGSTRENILQTYTPQISEDNGGAELVFAPRARAFKGKIIKFGMVNGKVEFFIAGQRKWAELLPCGSD
jgi:hypothetical protein